MGTIARGGLGVLLLLASSRSGYLGQKHTDMPHLREPLGDLCVLLLRQNGVHDLS